MKYAHTGIRHANLMRNICALTDFSYVTLVVLSVVTIIAITSRPVSAQPFNITEQAGHYLVGTEDTPTGAFTIKTQFQLGADAQDALTGVWLAGVAAVPGGIPQTLGLAWSQVSDGWFGDTWGIQLATNQKLLPAGLQPKNGDGFLLGCEYLSLLTLTPEWGHVYETTLGYTPKSGALSISVTDMTTNAVVLVRSMQLNAHPSQLYPATGWVVKPGTQIGSTLLRSFELQPFNVPYGLQAWVTQAETAGGMATPVMFVDRRKPAAIMFRLPWDHIPGEVHVTLDEGAAPIELLSVSQPKANQPYPINSDRINSDQLSRGKHRLTVAYTEGGHTWTIDQRELQVGQVTFGLRDLKYELSPDGAASFSGNVYFSSDGPIGDIPIDVRLNLNQHTFQRNLDTGKSAVKVTQVLTEFSIAHETLKLGAVESHIMPFAARIQLPADTNNHVWQATFVPNLITDALVNNAGLQTIWIGKTPLSEPWSGYLLQQKQVKTELAPGINSYEIKGRLPAGPVNMFILEAHLQPEVSIGGLLGFQQESQHLVRWPRSLVSAMVAHSNAIAGVNGSFFEIDDTMAPRSTVINAGELLRSPGSDWRGSLGVTRAGVPYIGNWQFAGTISKVVQGTASADSPLRSVYLGGVNQPALLTNSAVYFRAPWLKSAGFAGCPVTSTRRAVELVVDSPVQTQLGHLLGRLAEVRQNLPAITLKPDTGVIVGCGRVADQLAEIFQVGDTVDMALELSGVADGTELPTLPELMTVVSGGVVLVRNGVYGDKDVTEPPSSYGSTRHPRTAVGLSADRQTLYIVVVDGRSSQSIGMTYQELADLFLHMGAFEALNLDGGGSSAFAVRQSDGQVRTLNKPSDGTERPVPDGLGVFYEPH